jgi:outer membrane protein
LELGELEIKNQVVNTVATVINNYYNIVRQKQQLNAIEEQMSIDSERVRLAQYRLDVGMGIKPDLLQSKIDLNAQKALQLQQQALIEQFSFNSAYNFSRTQNQTVINNFSLLFNQVNGLNYGFTATVPILNNLNTRRLIKRARWSIDYQNIVYENQRSVTQLNVINAFQSYEQQQKELALEEENILLARENLDIVFQTYKLGAATLLQLKEAQNSLADAENSLIAARYNAKVSETELLRLSGQLIK